jgi:hypothetical protein
MNVAFPEQPAVAEAKGAVVSEPEPVPEDDSAWSVREKLPSWAKDAVKLIHESGGAVSKRRLVEKSYSNKQLKQMIHGRFPVMEYAGSQLILTRLGEKIAALGATEHDP